MTPEADTVAVSSDSSDDATESDTADIVFYPAYCYNASPTWFTWVKLTAYDVHYHLQTRRGYHAAPSLVSAGNNLSHHQPLLLFYLNHPVQFVQLVGVVVAFEDYFEKFWLFTLDDSSGATIEVNCRKPEKVEGEKCGSHPSPKEKNEVEGRGEVLRKLDIGSVVQVKGQIGTFREVRQLQLERITLVGDTNHEMRLVGARNKFLREVLRNPWRLTVAKQKSLHEHALGENEHQNRSARRRQNVHQARLEREKRHSERIAKQYQKEEQRRHVEAEEARHAGRMLESRGKHAAHGKAVSTRPIALPCK